MIRMLVIASAVALCGCAGAPLPTTDQLEVARRHDFGPADSAKVAKAIASVFRASRPGDYQVTVVPGEVRAQYTWTNLTLLDVAKGVDSWDVRLISDGPNLIGIAQRDDRSGDLFLTITQPTWDELSAYSLLWSRVDYVLGVRGDWQTCAQWRTSLDPSWPRVQLRSMCTEDAPESDVPPRL
jgi:hypothetical protein